MIMTPTRRLFGLFVVLLSYASYVSSISLKTLSWGKGIVVNTALVGVAAVIGGSTVPESAYAVSGGGLDFANKVITGEIFDNQKLASKDFSQCDGATSSFKGAALKGARFYRANLKEADFTGADLSGVSLEDTRLDKAIFKDALMEGAYPSASIEDVATLEGADLTDAQMPARSRKALCLRSDLDKANPTTGVSAFESLMCE